MKIMNNVPNHVPALGFAFVLQEYLSLRVAVLRAPR